jgi:GGDEF domain-containing protein
MAHAPDTPVSTEAPEADTRFARIVDAMLAPPSTGKRKKVPVAAAPPPEPERESAEAALARARTLILGGQVGPGLTLCHRVWPSVSQADDVLQMGVCQLVMVLGYQFMGLDRAAYTAGHRGLQLLARAGDDARLLHLLPLHARTLAKLGRASDAFDALDRGWRLLAKMGDDPRAHCRFWSNAAGTYAALELHDDMLACVERSAALAPLIDDAATAATAVSNLLSVRQLLLRTRHASWEDMRAAYEEVRRHMDALVAQGRQQLVLALAVECARTLMSVQRWDEAREVLRAGRSASIAAEIGPRLADIELRLAQLERLTGQYRLASVHIKAAQALAEQQGDPALRAEVHLENCLLLEAQGHWRHALDAHREYAAAREALHAGQGSSHWEALAERLRVKRERSEPEFMRLLRGDGAVDPADGRLGNESSGAIAADPETVVLRQRDEFRRQIGQWRAARPANTPLIVMIGGIDGFLKLRLRHSPSVVLQVLSTTGELLRRHLRPLDLLTPWEEGEFAVAVGVGSSLDESINTAARLSDIIERHDWSSLAPDFGVQLSVGVASFGSAEDFDDAMLRASWALHDARQEAIGRVRAMW